MRTAVISMGTTAGTPRLHYTAILIFAALASFIAIPAPAAQTITICKTTKPHGGTGFPFVWTNGSSGTPASFVLNDAQCHTFDATVLDKFNKYTETVPAGWSLTNIACTFTTSVVKIVGFDPQPGFQPGDNTVTIDLNEANVTCTFTNQPTSPPATDVYSVKFVCGSFLPEPPKNPASVEWPVKPGNYLTAINLHNPNHVPITFKKKAVLLYRADAPPEPEQPQPPGELFPADLKPDYGFEVDCSDIRKKLLGGAVPAPVFIKGWVVLEVIGLNDDPLQLDVTAVYTAHGWDQNVGPPPSYVGFSEDVESILPKRIK